MCVIFKVNCKYFSRLIRNCSTLLGNLYIDFYNSKFYNFISNCNSIELKKEIMFILTLRIVMLFLTNIETPSHILLKIPIELIQTS